MPTIDELKARRDLYIAAERAILTGNQSYTVEGATFSRADLSTIQRQIRELDAQITACSGGGFAAYQVRF